MKPRLSILIPCYNVERYIGGCLDSIYRIKLSRDEFEVLCFDDKSTDNTPNTLDKYASTYSNLIVVHSLANVGPGGGRNHLLSIAKGQYVWFVDGDDLIISDAVLSILEKAERNEADVITFNYKEWDNNENDITHAYSQPDLEVGKGCEMVDKIYEGGLVNDMGYPVRFIIRRDYLLRQNILFPENMRFGEDTVWMAKVVLYAAKMMSSSEYGYVYWHHEESTCGMLNRIYPGRTIYEKCILTSIQLIDFVNEIRIIGENQKEAILLTHADNIEKCTQNHYVNNLPIMLCRSTKQERRVFYNYFSLEKESEKLRKYANSLTKTILLNSVGPFISDMLSYIYKIKHR